MAASDEKEKKGYSKTSEPMLFVHALYFLAKSGPVKKSDFLEGMFKYLTENNILYPLDLEVTDSREGRERREKVIQIIRNLTGSHGTLVASQFVTEVDDTYVLDSGRLKQFSTIANVAMATKSSGAPHSVKSFGDKVPHNVVIYGPPGTGKTRAAAVIASSIMTGGKLDLEPEKLNLMEPAKNFGDLFRLRYFSTQFHPSFSYEDFFEGLRPINNQFDDRSELTYSVVPGVFKIVCQIARAYLQPNEYGIDIPVKFKVNNPVGKRWLFEESVNQAVYKLSERPGVYKYKNKIIGYTGNKAPDVSTEVENPTNDGSYTVTWYYSGSEEEVDFVLFIDELNRGNPARVFGEALSLIEESKRLGKPEQADIILPYSHESFVVPPNVNIICAMNSSDKSLASLDHAFRRRFKFVYLAPAFEIVVSDSFKKRSEGVFSDEILESLRNHFEAINDALKATHVPQESYVGHSYLINLLRLSFAEDRDFKKEKKASRPTIEEIVRNNLKRVWENELHGLIRELVGDQRLEEFCDNFSEEVDELKSNKLFLAINEDIAKSLYKYLENIQPVRASFPWNKAA